MKETSAIFAVLLVCFLQTTPSLAAMRVGGTGYVVDHWQTEDGLPQNSVTAIAQTQTGYLWLATFNGLVRFDGARFKVFDSTTTPELISSRIVRLLADSRDRLWIVSEFGDLALFDRGRFTSIRPTMGAVAYVVEDADGKIWLHGETALVRFEDGQKIPLSGKDNTGFGWIRDVATGAKGNFWVTRKTGVGHYDGSEFVFSPSVLGEGETPDQLFPRRDGTLWAAFRSAGLAQYRQGQRVFSKSFPIPNSLVKTFCEDSAGNLWMGTLSHGVFRHGTNGHWEIFNTANGLSHDSIRSICEDREGNIWIGTDGGGLNRLKHTGFRMSATDLGVVLSVTEDLRGQQWLGFNGVGMKRVDGDQLVPVICLPFIEEKTAVWSVYADRRGDVWTSDLSGGLLRFHDGTFERHPYTGKDPILYLRALHEDREGSLWAGHLQGLLRYSKGHFSRFGREQGLPAVDVRALAENREGELFVGLNGGGLARLRGGQFKVFNSTNGLADDRIWSLHADSEGTLWIGTFGSGLSRFSSEKFFNYHGVLPAKVVTTILEDDTGHLWLGTLKGIIRVNRTALNSFADGKTGSLNYQYYDKSDGLSSAECSGGLQPAAWKGRDGKLWFATLKGVAGIDPASLPYNSIPPKVVIEESLIDDRPHNTGPMERLELPPGSTRFELRFTALSFSSAEKVRFRHWLEGVDKEWIDDGAKRVAPYMNVPPGEYRFHVKACNNDGVWNEEGASLGVVVLPFVWQTTWFRLMGSLVIVGGVLMLFRREITRLNRQREAQQAISRRLLESQEQERKRIAGELHDSLGQSLQLIKNRLMRLSANVAEPESKRQLHEIAEVTSQAMNEMRTISHALRPVELERVGLTRSVSALVQKMGEASSIRFLSEIDPIDGLLSPEMEMNFYRVLQESLNNVAKHSRASEVIVEIKTQNSELCLSVFDDGCGIETMKPAIGETPRFGLGMASMSERAKILGGRWEVLSAPGKGTRVTLTLSMPQPATRSS